MQKDHNIRTLLKILQSVQEDHGDTIITKHAQKVSRVFKVLKLDTMRKKKRRKKRGRNHEFR